MTDEELLRAAESLGFQAALLPVGDIPVNAQFRVYCEENRCGQYSADWSCPPDCGTPEEMYARLLSGEQALFLMSVRDIAGYEDHAAILDGKRQHNENEQRLLSLLRADGYDGFCVGASHCLLCSPCRKALGEDCAFPAQRYSCLSAYCIDAAATAALCGMHFAWNEKKLYCCGLVVLRRCSAEK